jgi:hypothetical protein
MAEQLLVGGVVGCHGSIVALFSGVQMGVGDGRARFTVHSLKWKTRNQVLLGDVGKE